ncbi:MAG TPA: transglycosylase SLT domain-containing protein [Terriglobia bacterium]|nr:transglycosylase SLT domain-containing protein [Terriglobia bacterium]
MKFLFTFLIGVILFPSAWVAPAPCAVPQGLPAVLVHLASKADSSRTWPELRRYAASSRSARDRSLAYFLLGYKEYKADQYDQAAKDLAKAASPLSPLADLADYYRASALYKGGHPEAVEGILGDFSRRYPSSTKHYEAVELLAWGYLQTGEAPKALQLLQSVAQVRERPALAAVLARAYADSGQLGLAAQTFQDIYSAFPTSPQAATARDALAKLKTQLGVNYPPVTDEIATARVERLYMAAHYSEALKVYEQLLKDRRNSVWAWQWNLGRAKCLIRLDQANAAAETLVNAVAPTPELDAERLATLVDAYARIEDDTQVAQTLNKLRVQYFNSRWHAAALLRAANYFMYKGEFDIAPLYYRTLREAFPQTALASEASWRYAWVEYVTGKTDEARKSLLGLIRNYPGSPYVPAAVYFLGRLEEGARPAEAHELYEFLVRHYRHGYYPLEASKRLRLLKKSSEGYKSSNSVPDFSIRELVSKVPAADPPDFGGCLPAAGGKDMVAFHVLAALHLDNLARQDIQSRLERHPKSPALAIALSRFEAEQGHTDYALHIAKKVVPDYYSQQFSDLPREMWELLFPSSHVRLIRRYAAINHLDPYLVMGLIRQESGFNSRATSPVDARGLMQILASTMPRSRRYRNSARRRLYEPAYNLRLGCAYLRELLKRYNGNVAEALAAYNAGPTNVDHWLSLHTYRDEQEFVESIPFPETRIYLKAVFGDSGVYRKLVSGTVQFAECSANPAKSRKKSAARLEGIFQSQTQTFLSAARELELP